MLIHVLTWDSLEPPEGQCDGHHLQHFEDPWGSVLDVESGSKEYQIIKSKHK